MFAAIKSFFATIETLFGAANKGAKALDHLAGWAEESAGSFADEARFNRAKQLKDMSKAPSAKAVTAIAA